MEMTRDLLYCILKMIAKKGDEDPEVLQIEGYDPNLVRYHAKLCIDAGWVYGEAGSANTVVESLTMAGQIALARFHKGFTIDAVLGV